MEQQEGDGDAGSPPHKPTKENKNVKKRGPTSLTIGGKSKNGKIRKISIKFNDKGQPIGKGRKSISTDVGRICRSYAPINCKKWKDVPDSVKAKMREVINEHYKCKSRVNWQDIVMDLVGGRFRGFKHNLNKKYIRPNLHNLERIRDPPAGYTTITTDQWRDFVAQRSSKAWKRIRKMAQESQSKNKYPHRLSRKGYAGLEEELQKERESEEPIDRHVLWKEARHNNGVFKDEAVREKAKKIDELSQQVEDGTLIIEGSNDVLTQALGTEEHNGRVRGVGQGVIPSVYFHRPTNTSKNLKSALKELAQVKNLYASLALELKRIGGQAPTDGTSPNAEKVASNSVRCSAVGTGSPLVSPLSQGLAKSRRTMEEFVHESDPSSLRLNMEKDMGIGIEVQTDPNPPVPPTVPPTDMDKLRKCKLALGSIDRVVAQGTIFETGGPNLLHGCVLGEANVRVSVDYLAAPEYASELLPIPTKDAKFLRQAVGGFVAWPRNLVIPRSEVVPSKKGKGKAPSKKENVKAPSKVDVVAANFESLVSSATKNSHAKAIYIVVDDQVFRTDDPDFEPIVEVPLFRDQLMEVIKCKEIGADVILLYMCFLYNKAKDLGVEGKIRFVLPAGARGHQEEDNSNVFFEYIESAQRGQIFLYPYNTGFHWVLVVVDPWMRHALYFDPMGNEIDENVIEIFKYACKKLDLGGKFSESKRPARTNKAMCPRQSGSVECGYYVLRYMRDIVHSHDTSPAQLFDSYETYGRALIDEVRVEFMNFIRDHM